MKSGADDHDFALFWTIYPRRPGANRGKAYRQWQARLKEGVMPEVMIVGAQAYRRFVEAAKFEPQFYKEAATFLGRDEHYLADWTIKASPGSDLVNRLKRGRDDGYTIEG